MNEEEQGFERLQASSPRADEDAERPRRFEFRKTGSLQRLDLFLAEKLPEHSRAFLQKLIEEGFVTLEPSPREVKRASKIANGALVRVRVPPPRKMDLDPVNLPITILYEDAHFAVIDKPAHLTVHPSLNQSGNTLVNALLYHLRDLSGIAGVERPGIVHRLDKETSGVLVVAKNDTAHQALARQFKDRTIHKTYIAIVRGEPEGWEGRVDLPLGKSYSHSKKQMIRMDGTGKEAVTDFRVLEKYRGYALLEVYPHTGRTHQIRVHLLHLRLPIACDKLYSREHAVYATDLMDQPRKPEERPLLSRQALHAARITLQHPDTREEMVFSASLHPDMQEFLNALNRYRALGR